MTPSQTDSTRADEEAAQWVVHLREGGLSPHRLQEYSEWVARNPEHLDRIEAYRRLYSKLETVLPALVDQGGIADSHPRIVLPRPRFFRRVMAVTAAAVAVTIAALWGSSRPEAFSTQAARRDSVTLADGSVVDLNARTDVQVRMTSKERRVQLLQGEAYFSVKSDPERPFVVETSSGAVRVLGTQFNVRATSSSLVEVTVVEGAVSVAPPGRPSACRLDAHDRIALGAGGAAFSRLSDTEVGDAVAWREGRVIFVGETLPAAVERFAAYHGRKIEVAPSLSHLVLGGRFRLDDLDQFLTDIAVSLPVSVLKAGPGRIRIVPR